MVLDKINKEVAKWERLLDTNKFFLMKPSQWSILLSKVMHSIQNLNPSFNHSL
jgi:hypothetical protein